jgi:hypothetical protein
MKINLFQKFSEHPSEVGETYWEHFREAAGLSTKMFCASLFQLVHAVFPFFDPPCGLDVGTLSEYLQGKKPDARKDKNM